MVGENKIFWTIIITVTAVCRSWTWHFSAFVSRVGIPHLISFTCFHGLGYLVLPLIHSSWPLIHWCQILPIPLMCRRYVQEKLTSAKKQPPSDSSYNLDSQHYLSVSCRWCGKHYGPPSIKVTSCRLQLIIQEADLETPFRCLGACMPQWQVLHARCETFIIGLRLNDSTGVRCQLTDSHAVDCTYSTLRAIVIIGGTSRVC